MKTDLVMWTLNSQKTLELSLKSIEKAIPNKVVNQKIVIDAHSNDRTRDIAKMFGWKVYDAEKVGIPFQANQALRMVQTEVFASFEHDIIVNPNWFKSVYSHLADQQVAVSQGFRLSTNPIMQKIDEYKGQRKLYKSLDNNLYKTEIIRKIGGFPTSHLISVDSELQKRVLQSGYKWIVDYDIVSYHLKDAKFRAIMKHTYERNLLRTKQESQSPFKELVRLINSPIRALDITLKTHSPYPLYAYPILRYEILKANLKKRF